MRSLLLPSPPLPLLPSRFGPGHVWEPCESATGEEEVWAEFSGEATAWCSGVCACVHEVMLASTLLVSILFVEQADIGADHSRGNHSIQDVSIRRSSSVVQNLRKERDFIGQLRTGGIGGDKVT